MPILKKIVIRNWRNIELQELDFSPNINCISGNNGEGKTNLLDAIYYLSMTKSAFGASDKFNFRKGTDEFALAGTYLMENGLESKITLKSGASREKKILHDGKAYDRISEHIGVLPIVMVCPSDSNLVSEGGEERRRFVSGVLSQIDRNHLHSMQQYLRLLAQRNALLKSDYCSDEILDSLEYAMDKTAGSIYLARKEFIGNLRPSVQSFYKALSSGRESVEIEYRSDLQKGPLGEQLRRNRDKDKCLGFTSAGIHRDDFVFLMNGDPIRKTGSQGQQKSFLVALKFAQYELMKNRYGYPPVLLLDDLFDKLDMQRTENLLQMVAGKDFGQIFLSDTNKIRLRSIVEKITSQSCYYEAEGGAFKK